MQSSPPIFPLPIITCPYFVTPTPAQEYQGWAKLQLFPNGQQPFMLNIIRPLSHLSCCCCELDALGVVRNSVMVSELDQRTGGRGCTMGVIHVPANMRSLRAEWNDIIAAHSILRSISYLSPHANTSLPFEGALWMELQRV